MLAQQIAQAHPKRLGADAETQGGGRGSAEQADQFAVRHPPREAQCRTLPT